MLIVARRQFPLFLWEWKEGGKGTDVHEEIQEAFSDEEAYVFVQLPFPCRAVHLERVPHELSDHQGAQDGAENELDDRGRVVPPFCAVREVAHGDVEEWASRHCVGGVS